MTLLWTQKQDVGPTGRIFPAMTFDASRERVVLFGGQVAGGVNTGDTWSWDGADWTQVSDMGPSARAGGALAFDVIRERVVLFGGTPITGAIDTWEWDGAETWRRANSSQPSTSKSSAAATRFRDTDQTPPAAPAPAAPRCQSLSVAARQASVSSPLLKANATA